MTLSEIKYNYEKKQGGYWFTRKTMAFFGDTMRNLSFYKSIFKSEWDIDGNWLGEGKTRIFEGYVVYRKNKTSKGAPAKNLAVFEVNTFRCHSYTASEEIN